MADRYPTSGVPSRPEIGVAIDGATLDPTVRRDVMEVDVHEEVNRHARLTLLVQNWNADARQVRHSDKGPFAPGKAIEVSLGYQSTLETVFSGVITSIACHFSAATGPTLQVDARSKSILLAHPPRSRVFEAATDGDIAQAIAADYGLSTRVNAGVTRPAVVQDRRTDWSLLVERAEVLGWVTYVRDDTLVFGPAASPPGDVPELTWGTNLSEIHLTEDLTKLADPIKAVAWDPEAQAVEDADADSGRSQVPSEGRATPTTAVGDTGWPKRQEMLPVSLPRSSAELDRLAIGRANRQALQHINGYGTTIGLPGLRIDGWVEISGVGSRVGGRHYLTAVRHRVSPNGFHTEFRVGLAERLAPPAAAAPVGAFRLGVVDDIDDPQGWGRVKVRFPWRSDGPEPAWARLATLDAGPKQGTWFVPDVGQEVVVAGLEGDEGHPIVVGSLWNGQQTVPISIDPKVNGIRAIVTRSGHRLEFDDGDGKLVRVETAGGHRIVLDDAGKTVTVEEAGSKNKIELAKDGITVSAASGDVTISAPAGKIKLAASGLEVKSTGPAKVESSATLDLKASATLGLRGALVNIN